MLAWKIRLPSLSSCSRAASRPRGSGRPPCRSGVEDVDDVAGRGRDRDAPAVGRDRHVVRALAVDHEAPDDLAGVEVDRDDVGEARPGDDQQPAVVRAEHVVDELVVPLADQLADRQEVAEPLGVGRDLGHPLVVVGDDVDPRHPLEPRRGMSTSAVPSQLLPTKTAGRSLPRCSVARWPSPWPGCRAGLGVTAPIVTAARTRIRPRTAFRRQRVVAAPPIKRPENSRFGARPRRFLAGGPTPALDRVDEQVIGRAGGAQRAARVRASGSSARPHRARRPRPGPRLPWPRRRRGPRC